jgi:uncharacterized membrane protein YeaQ/YmgE (transglycosylase-associated protein family)
MINVYLWLLFGFLAGFIVSHLSDRLVPSYIIINSVAGVLGAMLAGAAFLIFDVTPLDAISLWSMLVALVGAFIAISLARIVFRHLI